MRRSRAVSSLGCRLLVLTWWTVFLAPFAWSTAFAQDDEDEPALIPGIVVHFQAKNKTITRVDEDINFHWGTYSPDERLPPGPFSARWEATLFVRRSDNYTFSAELEGQVKVSLNGKNILEGTNKTVALLEGTPQKLTFGFYPLVVEYQRPGDTGALRLFWEAAHFDRELLPGWAMSRSKESVKSTNSTVGANLIRAARCQACHQLPMTTASLRAPSLLHVRDTIQQQWLVDYLGSPHTGKAGVNMPSMGLSRAEAEAIAAFLRAASQPIKSARGATAKPEKGNPQKGKSTKTLSLQGNLIQKNFNHPNPENGKKLATSIGCLACHHWQKTGIPSPFGGGDLSSVGDKRPANFFENWLRQPETMNPRHRMPVFTLEKPEIADLAAFMAQLKTKKSAPSSSGKLMEDATLVARGKKLAMEKRCAACHDIPGIANPPALSWRLENLSNSSGCMGEAEPTTHRPGYSWKPDERQAARQYLNALVLPVQKLPLDGKLEVILAENQCLQCHARGTKDGLRAMARHLGIHDPKIQAAMVPPSLNTVGDKLHKSWLERAVRGNAPRLRPWLAPRMPKFPLTEEETKVLVQGFIQKDRVPERPDQYKNSDPQASSAPKELATYQLIGGKGLGCMSCHRIGDYQPQGVEPGALGADLRHLGNRMNYAWFRRWTKDPARLAPGVEMPAIRLAVPGVLGGSIPAQLEALWVGLNAPKLELPTASAVQVLQSRPNTRAMVVRDPFELATQRHVAKPLAVGLHHGHNILFDLDTFSIRRWWLGDFARQRTRGKTWFWEPAGITVWDGGHSWPELVARDQNGGFKPIWRDNSRAILREIQHLDLGLKVVFQLSRNPPRQTIVWTIKPTTKGVRWEWNVPTLPNGESLWLKYPLPGNGNISLDHSSLEWIGPGGKTTIRVSTGKTLPIQTRGSWWIPLTATSETPQVIHWECSAEPPRDYGKLPAPLPAQIHKKLPVLAGFDVERLPLPSEPMPTAITWLADGTMVTSSLKGEIYRVIDSNRDGLLDSYQPYSDHLASPFGLMSDGSSLLVAHKPELLRLRDDDGDGFAERSEVVASGWGITFDYHDWNVGPVRDRAGNLYIALQCQQDDRAPSAAFQRGKMLRIDPHGQVTEYAAGLRFAMGLAMSPNDELFASDNQGVTNPFNELNHIRPGHHYKFFNKLERRSGQEKGSNPAIQLPHPWTRSVNGIIFFPNDGSLGPYRGQLLGADYTTRKLIRMSLQKVGETYQGCAYPFSSEQPNLLDRDETFLGPIALALGPDRCLYVGSMVDSGWGGGNNRGAIERVRFLGTVPFGIREARAWRHGFDVDFTAPVDPVKALDSRNYQISCYRRIPQGGYDTPDQDQTRVTVEKITLHDQGKRVRLRVQPLRAGFVHDIAISNIAADGTMGFPSIAHFSLNEIPDVE